MSAPITLVIENAALLAMDGDRRVQAPAHLLVAGDRIAGLGAGPAPPVEARERIDADGAMLLPGLIDTHAHAGHALTKGLGGGAAEWMALAGHIYAQATDAAFWRAEAALSALERLRCGVTTALLLFGGGPDVMRTDTEDAAEAHREGVRAVGVAEVLAVGPNRPTGPRFYADWSGGVARQQPVSPRRQLEICDALLAGGRDPLRRFAMSLPVFSATELDEEALSLSRETFALARRHGVVLTQDGHRDGSIALAQERLGLFGRDCLLAHCIDLTDADIAALERTGAAVAHNPSALMSVVGACPAPELMDRAITVALGSDAPAPDRGFDPFRLMFQAHRYHARRLRDDSVLAPWTLLDMATRHAARALSQESDIGVLAPGLRADLILVGWRKPHLWPPAEPAQRLARYATGADVDTVVVAGRVLMRERRPVGIDEERILADAADAYATMLDRAGLARRFPPLPVRTQATP